MYINIIINMTLSVHRLSGAVLCGELSASFCFSTHTAERWKRTWCDDVLVLWSDAILFRTVGRRQLHKVTVVVSQPCSNEDTRPLDVFLAGQQRRQISPTPVVRLCDWSKSIIQVKKSVACKPFVHLLL